MRAWTYRRCQSVKRGKEEGEAARSLHEHGTQAMGDDNEKRRRRQGLESVDTDFRKEQFPVEGRRR
jgi:hypothetical protein